jgi:septum formation protein
VAFRTVASRYPEEMAVGAAPADLVRGHALGKAREVAARAGVPRPGAVLGADTAVVLGDRTLGKPADAAEARRMIATLSGRDHVVMTGVALVGAEEDVRHAETLVRFRALTSEEIDWYVATGEWRDRAGGYALQGAGAVLIERIEGDCTNVIGLPVPLVAELLARSRLAPWQARRR